MQGIRKDLLEGLNVHGLGFRVRMYLDPSHVVPFLVVLIRVLTRNTKKGTALEGLGRVKFRTHWV